MLLEVNEMQATLQDCHLNKDVTVQSFSYDEVASVFISLNPSKAPGDDGIPGKVLTKCYPNLTNILTIIFNMSLSQSKYPLLWKRSKLIPVPKSKHPSSVSDFRPVALTSIISKCYEKLILSRIRLLLPSTLDRYQFGYKEGFSTVDALCTTIHEICSHLDKKSSNAVRCMFLDFSSAFNTISPVRLVQKMLYDYRLPASICKLIFDFMINRTQYVVTNKTKSTISTTNVGSPQGCILSPFLFCLYTNDLKSQLNDVKIIKYADDTLIIGKIADNNCESYMHTLQWVEDWCQENCLILNANKTKELIFDFAKNSRRWEMVKINGKEIERASSIKYLGCEIDERLTFKNRSETTIKKAKSRRHMVYKLYEFNVEKRFISTAYNAFVRSVIMYALPSYYYLMSAQDKNTMKKCILNVKTTKYVLYKMQYINSWQR